MAIQSFANRGVQRFFVEGRTPAKAGWANVARIARRKLDMIDYAKVVKDLASPPGNRLESLKADLAGFHSIRITSQWRVIFRWTSAGPEVVDIVDYH